VSGNPRGDREWEHWPGRKAPDERIRHRLKALFTVTDEEDAVQALITERGREIQARTEQLQATIADLERREEQTGRLRSAVEEMLRHGSAELDERHAELAALALELGARDEKVRAGERDLAVRKQELGAVELQRAAVERRDEAATEREATLERIADELTSRELHLAETERRFGEVDTEIGNRQRALAASQAAVLERERRVADQETELARIAAELAEREQLLQAERVNVTAGREELSRAVATVSSGLRLPGGEDARDLDAAGHILYVTGDGYRMLERGGPAPGLDALVEIEGREFTVTRVGRSPLPGDRRSCAYLEPAGAHPNA
jgi:chromosome segregation ATPase